MGSGSRSRPGGGIHAFFLVNTEPTTSPGTGVTVTPVITHAIGLIGDFFLVRIGVGFLDQNLGHFFITDLLLFIPFVEIDNPFLHHLNHMGRQGGKLNINPGGILRIHLGRSDPIDIEVIPFLQIHHVDPLFEGPVNGEKNEIEKFLRNRVGNHAVITGFLPGTILTPGILVIEFRNPAIGYHQRPIPANIRNPGFIVGRSEINHLDQRFLGPPNIVTVILFFRDLGFTVCGGQFTGRTNIIRFRLILLQTGKAHLPIGPEIVVGDDLDKEFFPDFRTSQEVIRVYDPDKIRPNRGLEGFDNIILRPSPPGLTVLDVLFVLI